MGLRVLSLAVACGAGCAFAFLALQCLALEQGPNCTATQYKQGDRCCQKCPPGNKVESECPDALSGCEPCESRHFQGAWTKEKHCTPHRYCDENAFLFVHRDGDATRDVVCRCRNGTHCSSHECQTCWQNTLCGPGQGVLREASHRSDTVCVECPNGTFSNISSATARCQPWSSCEDRKLVRKGNGTRTSDVVCGVPLLLPPTREAGRTHLLVLVLVPFAALVLGSVALLIYRRHRQDLWKPHWNQPEGPLPPVRQQPTEEEECPALPIQETLLGGQPVAQEDGKESRLAEQEQL
ncbi:tumor necrosis factor receptor superfamily member 5 isoform X2 [Rhineura floridana]|uniref:tumor necrosis factor receptor superfamily member 5 isoform X2 n=1 Tax=Rhineura floridana TaxID=261503 RepID=UPI002AC864FE|nr:tumor necrosis factor receptor superfamily member 5 isoform X2 [Rhineura floridana]